MADPSSKGIAKEHVREIDELRRTAEGTFIDQVQLKSRYEAATAGLLTNGIFDSDAWDKLTPGQQQAAQERLSSLKKDLLGPWPGRIDGPTDANHFMFRDYASNTAIVILTTLAVLGLLLDLTLICHEWETSTAGTRGETAKAGATSALSIISPSPKESEPADFTPSLTTQAADTITTAASTTSPSRSAAAGSSSAVSPTDQKKDGMERPGKVTEQAVLRMVILLGALGGFLHLASSMANYVGSRKLLRSWIIYYLLMPIQGAALAPIVYLLLRVGVLNQANTPTGAASPSDSLNLTGIYAFAALTGLFSKQAIEMLADVFSTIFKKVSAKDTLTKSDGAEK